MNHPDSGEGASCLRKRHTTTRHRLCAHLLPPDCRRLHLRKIRPRDAGAPPGEQEGRRRHVGARVNGRAFEQARGCRVYNAGEGAHLLSVRSSASKGVETSLREDTGGADEPVSTGLTVERTVSGWQWLCPRRRGPVLVEALDRRRRHTRHANRRILCWRRHCAGRAAVCAGRQRKCWLTARSDGCDAAVLQPRGRTRYFLQCQTRRGSQSLARGGEGRSGQPTALPPSPDTLCAAGPSPPQSIPPRSLGSLYGAVRRDKEHARIEETLTFTRPASAGTCAPAIDPGLASRPNAIVAAICRPSNTRFLSPAICAQPRGHFRSGDFACGTAAGSSPRGRHSFTRPGAHTGGRGAADGDGRQ